MTDRCINCQGDLTRENGVLVCPLCNSDQLSVAEVFTETASDQDHEFIKCPGATLYVDGSNEIEAGVKFTDDSDPSKFEIVNHPVFAPEHKQLRRIKKDAVGRIRRCEACQDFTIRMRRREGPDFCAPSVKHPRRKKLKSVNYRTYV